MNVIKNGTITTPFDEKRPLNLPPEKRWHVHGAYDVAGGDGLVRSPVEGIAQGFVIYRVPGGAWAAKEKSLVTDIPWRNYFQDIYGGVIAIIEHKTQRLHLLCHIFPEAILDGSAKATAHFKYQDYIETAEYGQFPAHLMRTAKIEVEAGDVLAPVGKAGQVSGATGLHVHWEIHHSYKKLDDYAARINPKEYL